MSRPPTLRARLERARNGLRRLRAALSGTPVLPPNLRIGSGVYVGRSVQFDWRHAHLIVIEDEAIVSDGSRILCHDASSTRRLGVVWVAPVRICQGAFVGADSLILPGVTIGRGALVGAGSVVASDVPPEAVVVGNPARQIGTTADLDARREQLLEEHPYFPGSRYLGLALSRERMAELRVAAEAFGGYFLVEPRAYPDVSRRHPAR